MGAAAWSTPAAIESYSSHGPTPDGRVKPDIVGADMGTTVTYGSGFFGTSQATAHVAGLVALASQVFPAFSPSQVTGYLKNLALPRGSTPNNTWGYGFAWLPNLGTIPPSPTGLAAMPAGFSQVQLTWTTVANATSYTVKRGTVSGAQAVLASGVIGTSYTDSTVTRGVRYFYVVSAVNNAGESANSSEVSVTVPNAFVNGDFDGDGKTDVVVSRSSIGAWYVLKSSTNFIGFTSYIWGQSGDIPLQGDFDGDRMADVAVYRPSNGGWYILRSSTNFADSILYFWGQSGDIPVQGDFDGDGKADVTAYRPSSGAWFIRYSSQGYNVASYAEFSWGVAGDVPLGGDFDRDGKTDLAVYRPSAGMWYIRYSSLGFSVGGFGAFQWGIPGDRPLIGDFDGDGQTDLTIFRPSSGKWFIRYSSTGYAPTAYGHVAWGLAGDRPTIGDFDGDGKTEIAVYRPTTGQWFILFSSQNYNEATYAVHQWGAIGDTPVLSGPNIP